MVLEENKRRFEDEHVKYLRTHLCDKNSEKPFIFISYKSDDWDTVLQDVVYRLVKDYGLNVYFDGSFDTHNSLWITQLLENMGHYNCRGVLAFFDNKYATSYATLLELMYSQTKIADEKPVIPVNLDPLKKVSGPMGNDCTGLGIVSRDDGTSNINAKAEEDLFNETFDELVERGILKDSKYMYKKNKKLTKRICSEIVKELIAYLRVNENAYKRGGSLEGIVGSIKDVCNNDVFSDVVEENIPEMVRSRNKASSLYTYVFAGNKYEKHKLKDVMLTVFKGILVKHEDKLDSLLDRLSCLGEGALIKKDARPTVFRAGEVIFVGKRQISIGTSLDAKAVFRYIETLLAICEEPGDILREVETVGKNSSKSAPGVVMGPVKWEQGVVEKRKKATADTYYFSLYGKRYEGKKLKELLLIVFKEVMPRHENKLNDLLGNLSCLGEGDLIRKDARPTVFRQGETIEIDSRLISIGTSLGRGSVLGYIGTLMAICEESKKNLTIDNYEY